MEEGGREVREENLGADPSGSGTSHGRHTVPDRFRAPLERKFPGGSGGSSGRRLPCLIRCRPPPPLLLRVLASQGDAGAEPRARARFGVHFGYMTGRGCLEHTSVTMARGGRGEVEEERAEVPWREEIQVRG